jgi:hypothetical protein
MSVHILPQNHITFYFPTSAEYRIMSAFILAVRTEAGCRLKHQRFLWEE